MGWQVFYSMWPFNFSEADDFNESYFTGFYASRYTIGVENAMRTADYYIKEECPGSRQYEAKYKKEFESDKIPSEYQGEGIKKIIHNRELTYYLVPVWLLNIKYVNRTYTIAMNGQTGKICADDLADNPLYYTWFKRIYLIVQLIDFILGFLVLKRIDREVSFETFDFIVILIGMSVFSTFLFNLIITSIICRLIFRRTRKKLKPIEKNRLFYVRDFLE